VFYLGTTPAVDLAGADMLEELREHFEKRGIAFRLAGARGNVRDALARAGYGGKGSTLKRQSVSEVLEEWRGSTTSSRTG